MMVAGTLLRDLLPRRLRIPGDDTPWVDVRNRRRTVRSALAGGRLLTIAGVILLFATTLMVLLDTVDTTAFAVVVGLTLLGLVGSAAWVLWYRYQESTGAIQRRQLQVTSSRPGPARPADRTHARRPPSDDPDAPGTGSRPGSERGPRPARPDADDPQRRRPEPPERREREGRRTPDAPVERAGTARRTERYPARPGSQTDHRSLAPRDDGSAPGPPRRDPSRQPARQPLDSERDVRDGAASAPTGGSEPRPGAPGSWPSGSRSRS